MGDEMAMPVQQSYLMFLYNGLGLRYALLLPLMALISFNLTLLVVLRGRGAAAGFALLFIVPMPLFVGVHGYCDGWIAAGQVFAAGAKPMPGGVELGTAMSLVAPMVGMWFTIPSYLLAMIGLLMRSWRGDLRGPEAGRS